MCSFFDAVTTRALLLLLILSVSAALFYFFVFLSQVYVVFGAEPEELVVDAVLLVEPADLGLGQLRPEVLLDLGGAGSQRPVAIVPPRNLFGVVHKVKQNLQRRAIKNRNLFHENH